MRIGPAALAACVACIPLITAGCKGSETAAPAAEARPPAAVAVAPVKGVDEPVIIEATGSFQADESSDVAPGSVRPGHRDAGRRRPARREGGGADSHPGRRRQPAARRGARRGARGPTPTSSWPSRRTRWRRPPRSATRRSWQRADVSQTVADQARTQAETSAQNVATARASLAQARAQLALAEKAVADVVVVAPFAGFISQRRVSLGEYVQPSTAGRHAAQDRSAAAAADDSRRAGRRRSRSDRR